ncbi:nuclear transport factor 2 family protein [uncultured Roseobacter sp.]|uniref:nuclear transport factor 2 family protein n=1 Tax=uncultured Roseobacter sp. TaxID=114847 RepID=UPI0026073778|nr:nuclear transport factor 2 family protein [uncultured Roseobacter sp.]
MTASLSVERQETLKAFYHGATVKDAAQIRAALTDDFTFDGPIGSHDNPETFVQSLLAFDGSVTASKMIAEGDSLVHTYILDIGIKIPMCDVIEFRGNKLASMVLYTDSKLFDPNSKH